LLICEKAWRGTPHPKKFAAGVAGTALLTTVNLAYSTVYQPTTAPVLFTLKAKFGTPRVDLDRQIIHLPLTLQAKNTGKVPAYIIGDEYSVYGLKANFSENARELRERRKAMEYGYDVGRYIDIPKKQTISAGPFYGPGSFLEPDEEYSEEKVVQLPMSAGYDTIAADLTLEIMRKDRGKVDLEEFLVKHPSWNKNEGIFYCPPGECGERIAYRARLRHNNNIINVTRRPVYVTSIWGASPKSSHSAAYISSSPNFVPKTPKDAKKAEGESSRERERYGVGIVDAQVAMPFAALLNPSGT
jgi:hypothetical protein